MNQQQIIEALRQKFSNAHASGIYILTENEIADFIVNIMKPQPRDIEAKGKWYFDTAVDDWVYVTYRFTREQILELKQVYENGGGRGIKLLTHAIVRITGFQVDSAELLAEGMIDDAFYAEEMQGA